MPHKAVLPGLIPSCSWDAATELDGDASRQGVCLSHLLPNACLIAASELPLCLQRLWSSLCLLGSPTRHPPGSCAWSPQPGRGQEFPSHARRMRSRGGSRTWEQRKVLAPLQHLSPQRWGFGGQSQALPGPTACPLPLGNPWHGVQAESSSVQKKR